MLTTAFPFLAAISFLVASPLLVQRAKHQVSSWLAASRPYAPISLDQVPDYLAPRQILVYVEYAADIAQIVPTIALTGIGLVVGLPKSISPAVAAAITLGIVLALVIVDSALLFVSPQRYVSQKILRLLSPVAFAGIVVNMIAMAISLALK